jgi:hypothetical protein
MHIVYEFHVKLMLWRLKIFMVTIEKCFKMPKLAVYRKLRHSPAENFGRGAEASLHVAIIIISECRHINIGLYRCKHREL